MPRGKAKVEATWDEELEEKIEKKADKWAKTCGPMCKSSNAGGGAVYCLGVVGALFYWIGTAPDFWAGVLGVLKAFLWPGFIVYELLNFFAL